MLRLEVFCYGFPGPKTFRDLRETGPWTVTSSQKIVQFIPAALKLNRLIPVNGETLLRYFK